MATKTMDLARLRNGNTVVTVTYDDVTHTISAVSATSGRAVTATLRAGATSKVSAVAAGTHALTVPTGATWGAGTSTDLTHNLHD